MFNKSHQQQVTNPDPSAIFSTTSNFSNKKETPRDLFAIVARISKLEKYDQLHILRVIHTQAPELLTENQNGNFVNLADVSDLVLDEVVRLTVLFEAQNADLQKGYGTNTA